MWLKIHKQSERESYSAKKHGKVTMAEGTNPTTTKNAKYFVFSLFVSFLVVIALLSSTIVAFVRFLWL